MRRAAVVQPMEVQVARPADEAQPAPLPAEGVGRGTLGARPPRRLVLGAGRGACGHEDPQRALRTWTGLRGGHGAPAQPAETATPPSYQAAEPDRGPVPPPFPQPTDSGGTPGGGKMMRTRGVTLRQSRRRTTWATPRSRMRQREGKARRRHRVWRRHQRSTTRARREKARVADDSSRSKVGVLATLAQAEGLGDVDYDRGRRISKKLRRDLLAAVEEFKAQQHEELMLLAGQARQIGYELGRLRRERYAVVERQRCVERERARDQLLVWGVPPEARWREHTERRCIRCCARNWASRTSASGSGRPL